jgi:hypothetical protein
VSFCKKINGEKEGEDFFSGKCLDERCERKKRRQGRLWRSPLRISQVSSKGKSRDAGVSVEAFDNHIVGGVIVVEVVTQYL